MTDIARVLTRKRWRLHAHDKDIVVVRGGNERFVHPLMKAFIWALYLPQYPDASIEIRIGDKYKPDVVAFGENRGIYQPKEPTFWGEAGRVGKDKIFSIVKRFPDTHFCMAKWDTRLDPYVELVQEALDGVERRAPFDLIRFHDGDERFVDDGGNITIGFEDVTLVRIDGEQ